MAVAVGGCLGCGDCFCCMFEGIWTMVGVVDVVKWTTCLICCLGFRFAGFLFRDLEDLEDRFLVAMAIDPASGLLRAAAANASRLSLAFLKSKLA